MKTITKLFLALCLVVGLGAALTTNAQIESDVTIRASIPHPFVVSNTTLPAGTYLIKVVDGDADLNTLEIRSVDRKLAVFFETDDVAAKHAMSTGELVFDKLGDTYFLSRVFLSGDPSGNELPKSKTQRKLEEGGLKAENHSIAASRMQAKSSKQTAAKQD
jgi:hypothetical protein